MTVFFDPSGLLDVATDPSDLPETANGGDVQSGAMTRCKNLRLNQKGIAITRDGSAKVNTQALSGSVSWVEEQQGHRYAFAGGSIYEDGAELISAMRSDPWSCIKYNPFNDSTPNIFATNGTDRKRIESGVVYEWGIDAPTLAPSLQPGHGGNLTGQYNAVYTYCRKVGSVIVAESNPSPAATDTIVLTGQSLGVSVAQPTDPQVTHIRLYRTFAGLTEYHFDQDIAINIIYSYGCVFSWESDDGYLAGTGFVFTTADTANGSQDTSTWEYRWSDVDLTATFFPVSLPFGGFNFSVINSALAVAAGNITNVSDPNYASSEPFGQFDSLAADGALGDLIEIDHDRLPLGASLVFGPAYDGTCFAIVGNLLYYCKAKQPEYWPALNYVEISTPQFPGQSAVFNNGQVYYLTGIDIFYIQGSGGSTFLPFQMKAKTGAQSVRGALSVFGKGIYHTGPDGVYQFQMGLDTRITEHTLEPLFRGEDTQGMPGVSTMENSWLWEYRNHLYFGYCSQGFPYPTNVLVINLETLRTAYFSYNDGAAIQLRSITTDQTRDLMLIGDAAGFVRIIESPAYSDDSGTAIGFEVQSKDYELQTRKHFPRWAKYDIDASLAVSCTAEMLLDGVTVTSHTITGARDTRRRLTQVDNGNKCSLRISGSGQVSIYAAEFE